VFLTGGTSLVPRIRRIFVDRFGEDRIETGGELTSIAHGLALIGLEDDLAAWAVQRSPVLRPTTLKTRKAAPIRSVTD